MISNHPYQRNGLGGIDDNGQVPCGRCGRPEGVHSQDTWPDGRPVTPWADPWHDILADLRETVPGPWGTG